MDYLVVRVDWRRRSVWLRDGTRLGFAHARRLGIDVEECQRRLAGAA